MHKFEIQVGDEYVLREARKRDASVQRVKVLQHVRGKKWKAEWIEPNPGLVDYVESQDLIVRWKERKAFFQEEERERQLRAENERHGYEEDSPLANALYVVFESAGEKQLSFYRGVLSGPHEALERVKQRARMDQNKASVIAYVDRHGTTHIPFAEALEIAKAFCAAEPSAVLVSIEATERKWSQEALQPGGDYLVGLLNEHRASWALIRQWAGQDAAIAQREAQIQRLERLAWDAIYALQKAGLDEPAHRLRRAIERK